MTVPGSGDFANPMGNTHGGILLCAAEMAGSLALHAEASLLQTSSQCTLGRSRSSTTTS